MAPSQPSSFGARPLWLTFDCYGTLIQWDEGLDAAVAAICARYGAGHVDRAALIERYDHHEHRLEAEPPHRSFRSVAGDGLRLALAELGLPCDEQDIAQLTRSISAMPPFPEVPGALRQLKAAGFRTCIISNTDDAIIAGNVAQLGPDAIDVVVTAQQAGAYKPSRRIFETAWNRIGVAREDVVHICASPHLDHAAARDLGFRCIWIDRGSGRALLPDYTPDMTLPTLDRVPAYFAWLGWTSAG